MNLMLNELNEFILLPVIIFVEFADISLGLFDFVHSIFIVENSVACPVLL